MYGINHSISGQDGREANALVSCTQTNPSQGERHYLWILLHHIVGAKSFDDPEDITRGYSTPDIQGNSNSIWLAGK